jgi:hypothetical protein
MAKVGDRFGSAPVIKNSEPNFRFGSEAEIQTDHQNPMCGAKAIDDAMPELDSLVIGDAVYVLTGWPIMQALTREPHHCNVLRACSSDIV